MIARLFEHPRPVPRRLVPALAGAAVVALALPVFVAAGWPLAGWVLAAALWVAGQALATLLGRLPLGVDSLAASGVVGIGMSFRGVAIGVVLVAVAATNAAVGVAALLLYALAYTLELAISLAVYFGSAAR